MSVYVPGYKIYLGFLTKLPNVQGLPNKVTKPGITLSFDALKRLNYVGDDEPYPISNYFKTKILISTSKIFKKKEQAEYAEHYLQRLVSSDNFHDFYYKEPISGITEMRQFNYEENGILYSEIEKFKQLTLQEILSHIGEQDKNCWDSFYNKKRQRFHLIEEDLRKEVFDHV